MYATCNVPADILEHLTQSVDTLTNKFDHLQKANAGLAGNLEFSFSLSDSSRVLNPFINQVVKEFWTHYGEDALAKEDYEITTSVLIASAELSGSQKFDVPMESNVWVNFQKKYEFNPPHIHNNGLLSFVIWLKLPFNIEDEDTQPHVINSTIPAAGRFNFFVNNPNSTGGVHIVSIPADKKLEGTMVIFPVWLMHSVNPFYTSDDYRISVAGNIGRKRTI
jgi:hypothetical protein